MIFSTYSHGFGVHSRLPLSNHEAGHTHSLTTACHSDLGPAGSSLLVRTYGIICPFFRCTTRRYNRQNVLAAVLCSSGSLGWLLPERAKKVHINRRDHMGKLFLGHTVPQVPFLNFLPNLRGGLMSIGHIAIQCQIQSSRCLRSRVKQLTGLPSQLVIQVNKQITSKATGTVPYSSQPPSHLAHHQPLHIQCMNPDAVTGLESEFETSQSRSRPS